MEAAKKTYAWKESVELAAKLTEICEQFSDQNGNELVRQLSQVAVEIPAGVAADILNGGKPNTQPLVRLEAILALVEKVYPAIDTTPAQSKLGPLWQRFGSAKALAEAPAAPGKPAAVGVPATPRGGNPTTAPVRPEVSRKVTTLKVKQG